MKASALKIEPKKEIRNNTSLGIQTFGENNDYPQQCREIVEGSGTGSLCVRTYSKFINGKGFDNNFIINKKKEKVNDVLRLIARDYAVHGGFALHLNYNSLYEISSIQHVPFETVRFGDVDKDTGIFNKIVTHWDWARRMTSIRPFKKEDKIEFHIYDPEPETIARQVEECEGWENYKGQILYFSSEGRLTYPLAPYDAVLTDMNSEEGASNVKNRNVKSNFLPAGMIVDKRNPTETEDQENELKTALTEFQTDRNSGKLVYVQVSDESEVPAFIPMDIKNYDKEFTYTEESVQNNIGQIFNIPPLLRGRDVGAGFGAELMNNSYNFYNNITEPERNDITNLFNELFKLWSTEIPELTIIPLQYAN